MPKAIESKQPQSMDEHVVFGQPANAAKSDAQIKEDAPFSNKNPHGEATIKVRVRAGVTMQFEGDYISEGAEVDMPVSMALNAAHLIEAVTEDGTPQPIHMAIPAIAQPFNAAEITGATHERVEKLEREIALLDERRASLQSRLDKAKAQQETEISERAKHAQNPVATEPVKATDTVTAAPTTRHDGDVDAPSVKPGRSKS